MSNKTTVRIVIPSWNGRNLLKECLGSISKQTYKQFLISVVDNGSTDGTEGFLRKNFPEVKIIKMEKNKGFAKAVNEGIKQSTERYIAILNNDVSLDNNWLAELVLSIGKNKKTGGVCPKVINYGNRTKIDSAGDKINILGQAFHRGENQCVCNFEKEEKVSLITACASLFKKSLFKKIGMLDESFFAYNEDVDLCLRARLQGFNFVYNPRSIAYHKVGQTALNLKKKKYYFQYRNSIITLLKNLPTCCFLKRGRLWKIPLYHMNSVFYSFSKGMLREALGSYSWLVFNALSIFKKRAAIQKNRKITIEEVEKIFSDKKITFWGIIPN